MELCIEGDRLIESCYSDSTYKSQGLKGGVSFPTCISTDNIICHFSPCLLDPEASLACLASGSLVKIELGVHVDGYPALVGNSFICGESEPEISPQAKSSCPASREKTSKANLKKLIDATYEASQAVLEVLKVSNLNSESGLYQSSQDSAAFSDVVCKVAQKHSLTAVQGALSYQIGRNSLDLPKQIPINLPDKDRKKVPTFYFQEGESYAVDVVLSTGDGKIRAGSVKTCIFRRIPHTYQLKLATSRSAIGEAGKRFGDFSFNIRNANDPKKMRMGMHECVSHGCVSPSDVLVESEGSVVERFLYTVLLSKDGPILVTTADKS